MAGPRPFRISNGGLGIADGGLAGGSASLAEARVAARASSRRASAAVGVMGVLLVTGSSSRLRAGARVPCGGRPCIRGMRIRVSDVLDLFAAGLSAEEILKEM